MWFDATKANLAAFYCRTCPLQRECAKLGESEEYGVWGGINAEAQQEERSAERQQEREDRNVAVCQLRDAGHTVRAIAAQVGLSKSAVSKILQAA
jgi:DNA-binding NarL/FixJ family response regulator